MQKNLKLTISLSGLAEDFLSGWLEDKLSKIVADTANPIDDMLKASLMPLLQKEIMKTLEDLEKKNPMNLFDILEKFKEKEE